MILPFSSFTFNVKWVYVTASCKNPPEIRQRKIGQDHQVKYEDVLEAEKLEADCGEV